MKVLVHAISVTAIILFLSFSFAGAQSSSAISLVPGWNLISLPVRPTSTGIGTVLSGINGTYEVVWAYPGQSWKVYDPDDAAGSTLTAMQAGMGYWIKMTSASTLTLSGSPPSTSISLVPGWNLVGYYGDSCATPSNSSTSLTGLYNLGTNLQVLWGYAGQTQTWTLYNPTTGPQPSTFQLCPGGGYWINVNDAQMWTVPYDLKYTSLTTGASLSYALTGSDTAGGAYTGAIRSTVIGPTMLNGNSVVEKDTLYILTETGVGVVLSMTEKQYYNPDRTLAEIVFSDGVTATPVNAFVLPSVAVVGDFGGQTLDYSNGNVLTESWEIGSGSDGDLSATIDTTTNYNMSEVDTLTVTPTGDVPKITEVVYDFPSGGITTTLSGAESPSFGTETEVYDVSKFTSLLSGASLSYTFTGSDTTGGAYTGALRSTVVGPTTLNGKSVIEKDTLLTLTKTGVGVLLSTTEKAYYNPDRTLVEIVFSDGVIATAVNPFVLPATVQVGSFGGQTLDYSNGNVLTESWDVVNGSNDRVKITIASTTNSALSEVDTLTVTPTGDVPTITEVIHNFPSAGVATTLVGTEN